MATSVKRGFDIRRKTIYLVANGIALILILTVSLIFIYMRTVRQYNFFLNTISRKTLVLNQLEKGLNGSQIKLRTFLMDYDQAQFYAARDEIRQMQDLADQILVLDEEIAQISGDEEFHKGTEEFNRDLKSLIADLKEAAESVFDLEMYRGLVETSGLRGQLNKITAQIEESIFSSGSNELIQEYQKIRILEKDYILSGDVSFIGPFRDQLAVLEALLDNGTFAEKQALEKYSQAFSQLTEASSDVEGALSRLSMVNYAFNSMVDGEIEKNEEFLMSQRTKLGNRSRRDIRNILILSLVVILVQVVTALILLKAISKPMKFIIEETDRLEKGDLSADIDYKKNDEMGRVSQSINGAVSSFRSLISRAQGVSEKSVDLTTSIVATASETAAATTEINANITSINKKTNMLLEQVDNSNKATSDIRGVIGRFKDSVHNQTSSVEEATTAIEQMIATIQNVAQIATDRGAAAETLNRVTESGETQINNTNRMIGEVAQIAEDILNITKIINGIASQTNLLAMNAAIEAAHAGDVGRGFAVVADEIRKLAESSSVNAKQINTLLKEAGTRISSASEASQHSINSFQDVKSEVGIFVQALSEISASMSEMSIGSQEILKSTAHLTQSMTDISQETGEIVGDVDAISDSMNSVNILTNETTNGISEIQLAIGEIDKSIVDLNEKCVENEELMEKMDGSLKEFKV